MHIRGEYHLPVILLLLLTCGQGADSMLCSCNDHVSCQPLPSPDAPLASYTGNDSAPPRRLVVSKVCSIGPEGRCYTSKTYQPNLEKGKGYGTIVVSYGCIANVEHNTLQCRANEVPHFNPKVLACCNNTEFCNSYLDPKLPPNYENEFFLKLKENGLLSPDGLSDLTKKTDQPMSTKIVMLGSICIAVVTITLLILFLWYHYRHRLLQQLQNKTQRPSIPGLPEDARELLSGLGMTSSGVGVVVGGASMTSGSGSGPPVLVQRTISKQIQLVERIGQGRFGEVWRGQWRGDDLAVKMFSTTEEASWYRESQLYQSVTLRHDNILGFIASDVKGSGGFTQLFLITEYHPLGSLFAFLRCNGAMPSFMLPPAALSLVSGLNYLHTEIAGSRGKPALAHRDLKSSNVLVKADRTLCIADLGLAVLQADSLPVGPSTRAGTRRYMSPELLTAQGSLSFEAYRKADIYALGLVLWELSSRVLWPGMKEEDVPAPALPFGDVRDEDLVQTVCEERQRPMLPSPPSSDDSQMQRDVVRLLNECWSHNPDARLPALRIKKMLAKWTIREEAV